MLGDSVGDELEEEKLEGSKTAQEAICQYPRGTKVHAVDGAKVIDSAGRLDRA